MGWSLSYLEPKELELLNSFFMIIGKALYLVNSFESKCQYILRLAKIAFDFTKADCTLDLVDFIESLQDKILGQTIQELHRFPGIKPADIELLKRAKDSRNWIAHEGAEIGGLGYVSAEIIHKKLDLLRRKVQFLIAGDNLVSRWIYEIEENEPAPAHIMANYPKYIERWLFEEGDPFFHKGLSLEYYRETNHIRPEKVL